MRLRTIHSRRYSMWSIQIDTTRITQEPIEHWTIYERLLTFPMVGLTTKSCDGRNTRGMAPMKCILEMELELPAGSYNSTKQYHLRGRIRMCTPTAMKQLVPSSVTGFGGGSKCMMLNTFLHMLSKGLQPPWSIQRRIQKHTKCTDWYGTWLWWCNYIYMSPPWCLDVFSMVRLQILHGRIDRCWKEAVGFSRNSGRLLSCFLKCFGLGQSSNARWAHSSNRWHNLRMESKEIMLYPATLV